MSAGQQKVRIQIPSGYNRETRDAIAQRVIEFIQDRTASGKDIDGKKFPAYTKHYAEEEGVGRRDVDLVRTGNMLNSLSVLAVGTSFFTIGYEAGDPLNDQVKGNRTGSYGEAKPDPDRARDFLGISEKDLNKILLEFPLDQQEPTESELDKMDEKLRQSLINDARGRY